jgi:hypothetical protein
MIAHDIAKKPAIPYFGFILYHGIEFSIIEHFTTSGYKYSYYCNNEKGYFWHPQILTAGEPDYRAHMEGFPPLFIEIGETIINHHTGPNIRGVIEYVSFSVGGEFFQTNQLTTSK